MHWLDPEYPPVFATRVDGATIEVEHGGFKATMPGDCALLRYDSESRTDQDSFASLMTQ